jgi:hypothetical protein
LHDSKNQQQCVNSYVCLFVTLHHNTFNRRITLNPVFCMIKGMRFSLYGLRRLLKSTKMHLVETLELASEGEII